MTIEIETVEQLLSHSYTVGTWCPKCARRGPELNLAKYVLKGQGDMRPKDLRLKHATCRARLEIQIWPAKGYGK